MYKQYDNVLRDRDHLNIHRIREDPGSNYIYSSPIIANENIIKLNKDSQLTLKETRAQVNMMRSANDSTSKPSPTKLPMIINIDTLGNDTHKLHTYDYLAISRLIRRQERQYLQHITQNKGGYHNTHILDYKTNLFTNRLFYNISSKKLTKHEEHLLALGLKFTIDNHQTTDIELLIYLEEYHKHICTKYDIVNMLRHTTDESTSVIQRLKEYTNHIHRKIKDSYKNTDLRIVPTETLQRDETIKCHDSIDTIAINNYIKTCNTKNKKSIT